MLVIFFRQSPVQPGSFCSRFVLIEFWVFNMVMSNDLGVRIMYISLKRSAFKLNFNISTSQFWAKDSSVQIKCHSIIKCLNRTLIPTFPFFKEKSTLIYQNYGNAFYTNDYDNFINDRLRIWSIYFVYNVNVYGIQK